MGQSRGRVAFLAVLGLVAVSTGALLGRTPALETPTTGETPIGSAPATENRVRVHVSGMVVAPGVVDVPDGAIVADAIDAAGGLLAGAVVDQVNLAAPIADGDHIVVPGPGEAVAAGDATAAERVISLNRATPTDLESLPGVGPVLAERIVAFREEHGRFEVVEDLLEVPGIGEAKLKALRDLVRP